MPNSDLSFAEIAVDLLAYANRQARLNEIIEPAIAGMPDNSCMAMEFREHQRQALVLGQAHALFKAMCEDEDVIRRLIERREDRAASRNFQRMETRNAV